MTTAPDELADSQHPWIGLASFTEADREFFVGRGEEIDELFRLVRRDTLTLLYGVSGLGKTSLLQAGLFPALREEDYLPVPIRLDYLEGAAPLAAQVLDAITAAADAARVEAPQPRPDETLWKYFHREGNHFWSPRNDLVTPVIAFDQFEELFTLGRETPECAAQAAAFISELADLAENRPPAALRDDPLRAKEFNFKPAPLKVLLAMREDYLAELDRIRSHFRALGQNRLRLLPMGERQARQVIALGAPLLASGVEDRILKFVAGGFADAVEITIAPALLSLALRELNERRLSRGPDAKITPNLLDVEQQKIFEDFYLRTVQDFPAGVQRFIEDRLLTTTGYRDSCALDDALSCPDITLPILNELVNRRLLAYEDRHHTRRVELTHDVLIPAIKASRDTRLAREALARAKQQQREAFEKARVARRQLAVVGALLVLAVLAAIYGFWQAKVARETRAQADVDIALVYQRGDEAVDPRTLAHLARALRTLPNAALPHVVSLFRDRLWYLPLMEPLHHLSEVYGASFSADGSRILTASDDKTARIWDAKTGEPGEQLSHEGRVYAASFSADGARILTASTDKTVRIWDAKTGEPGEQLSHEGWVYAASLSEHGARVVTVSDDNKARIWDVNTRKQVGEELSHKGWVYAARFSADGARIVTLSTDKTARIWDANTGKPGKQLRHEDRVNAARFSADGVRIVTLLDDNTARIWDANTGKPVGEEMRHKATVNAASFSRDGARIVTVSNDNAAWIWDANTGKQVGEPLRHEAEVYAASFSWDGTRIVTASDDNTARIWDANTGKQVGEPLRHEAEVYAASFSADGARIVTASGDKTVRIWDANMGLKLGITLRHDNRVNALSFNADGTRVVTASAEKTAWIWDAKTGQRVGEPLRHEAALDAAASFGADGARLVTFSDDKATRAWDANTGQQMDKPPRHEGRVYAASFSMDGTRIVTLSTDKAARIWDANTGQQVGGPLRHELRVNAASFSADGARIVTASTDKTARIWDVNTGQQVGEPLRHEGRVNAASFSMDGTRILT